MSLLQKKKRYENDTVICPKLPLLPTENQGNTVGKWSLSTPSLSAKFCKKIDKNI